MRLVVHLWLFGAGLATRRGQPRPVLQAMQGLTSTGEPTPHYAHPSSGGDQESNSGGFEKALRSAAPAAVAAGMRSLPAAEEVEVEPAVDPYFVRLASGRRAKEIPNIEKYLISPPPPRC